MDFSDSPNPPSSICRPLWQYGLFAIDSEILVESRISIDDQHLMIDGHPIALDEFDSIRVVGAGKAGTGMARGLLKGLKKLRGRKPVSGLVNVPDPCVEELDGIELHGGRPAGVNEPTPAGQEGARRMLELVKTAGPRDLVIALISGGGSALAPLPVNGVDLEAKQRMTRFLSRRGANIHQLNRVRSAISQIKGGGLVREFHGHSLHALIISDVLGNPLEVIASGMTVPQTIDHAAALAILEKFDPARQEVDASIYQAIEKQRSTNGHGSGRDDIPPDDIPPDDSPAAEASRIRNHVIADNRTVVDAIGGMARQIGYEVHVQSATTVEDDAERVAERLWNLVGQRLEHGDLTRPCLFVSGGEPTVTLRDPAGKGGRNQHLALAFLEHLLRSPIDFPGQIELVSLGTDGEDGPTDAAGAVVHSQVIAQTRRLNLSPADYLNRNDSYRFFEQVGGLIKTGPTHTNVCDVRILALKPASGHPR